MVILVGIIWVVIGIVYIIYQGFKEKPRTTIAVFKIIGLFICLFVLPAVLVNLVIEMGGVTSWILSVFVALIPFMSLAVGAIYIINKVDDANAKRFSPDGIEKKCAEMTQLFKQSGYFVSASMINRLVLDYTSPLYNSEKIKVPIHECYKWLCVNRELELERKSDEELGEILGVVFDNIPLNDSKELGAAVLQRRALAIKYILERDGLAITEHSSRRHWMNDTSDYPQKFVQYVNEGGKKMLAVDLLWIVFGIIYVISKLQKEEHIFTKENVRLLLILSAFIIIPQIIVGVVCDEESAEVVRPIVTLVLIILPLLVLCIYGLSFSISGEYNAKKANAELNVRAKQSVQDLRKVFEERGFHNISTQMLEELLNNPISPLQTYGVAGTNLLTCYSWMCKQRTWEIDKLKDDELSCKIGVSLDAIPIDENLPIGEAHLRRTLLAKNYLLTKEGLRYQAFADGLQSRYKAKYLNENDEYYTTFNRFINEHTSEHQ